MNPRTLLIASLALLLIIGGGIVSLLSFFPRKVAETQPPSASSGLPLFGARTSGVSQNTNANTNAPQAGSSGTVEARSITGESVLVSDFSKAPDVKGVYEGDFYVSYPADPNAELQYEINYFPTDRSFNIIIAQEPIGEIRRSAAEDLKNRLGVSVTELCSLVVDVRVMKWANDFYAGKNLGLPGCPGSEKFAGDPGF